MKRIESTAINIVVSDESGYVFKVECKQGEHDGWTGHLTIYSRALMTVPDAVLENILVQAKQFVRIMEKE